MISSDYYEELNLHQIFKEYNRTNKELKEYVNDLNKGRINESVREVVENHIERLNKKIIEIKKVLVV